MPSLQEEEIRRWWGNPNAFGTTLLAMALDRFGTEMMSYEPETIRLELRSLLGKEPPQVNMDKLLALIAALSTNLFYVSVETFSQVCDALNHNVPNFYEWEPLEPEDLAWGIAEVTLVDSAPEGKNGTPQYSHEVRRYIGVTLSQYGITVPPPILKIAEMDTVPNRMSDDPAMVRAYYEGQRRETEDITTFVKTRTQALIAQLQRAPLQNRDPSTWASFVAKAQSRLGPWTATESPAPAQPA